MSASNAKASNSYETEEDAGAIYQDRTESGTTLVPDRKQSSQSESAIDWHRQTCISTSGNGYSDFFSDTSILLSDPFQSGTAEEPDIASPVVSLSLKEAVDFYKISEKTIRLQIQRS